MLGGFIYAGTQPPRWYRFRESEQLAKTCWEAIDPDTDLAQSNADDLVHSAINNPAGHLAHYWVDRISHLWENTTAAWVSMPPDIADYLADLMTDNSKRTHAVDVVFGGKLSFFYQADRAWCKQFLLPKFDWSDGARARRMWDGYLSHGGYTNELLADGLLEGMVSTIAHRDRLGQRPGRSLPLALALIALNADLAPRDWLKDLIRKGTTDDHVAWAVAIGRELRSLDPDLVESQWHRWMRAYVTDRVNSIPGTLHPREASAIAYWTIFLTDSMAAAVELLLRTRTAGVGNLSLFADIKDQQIQREPEQIARLVEHILEATVPPMYRAVDLQRIFGLLRANGVSTETLRGIQEAAMHLGIELG